MKKLVMDFPVITYTDENGESQVDVVKSKEKFEEIMQLIKQLNLRYEDENE
jgi:hypothetical protein